MNELHKKPVLAFVVDAFPVVSEPFIIEQVAGLLDRGFDVRIVAFKRGVTHGISDKFTSYSMAGRTVYIDVPKDIVTRAIRAVPRAFSLVRKDPRGLLNAINIFRYGRDALSLNLLYWADAFAGQTFELAHCHFGSIGNKFVRIKNVLRLPQKFITTFYGYDISRAFKQYGPRLYDDLKGECSLFFVMSENARKRVIAYGFDADKVVVHPIGINVNDYPFRERMAPDNRPVGIISVGRLVEKKGFDDLVKALAIARGKTSKPFRCTIVGDGPMKHHITEMVRSLHLDPLVDFKGSMKIEDIIPLLSKMDFFVQPSKTAADGNME